MKLVGVMYTSFDEIPTKNEERGRGFSSAMWPSRLARQADQKFVGS
jgi:hypothetical protein